MHDLVVFSWIISEFHLLYFSANGRINLIAFPFGMDFPLHHAVSTICAFLHGLGVRSDFHKYSPVPIFHPLFLLPT